MAVLDRGLVRLREGLRRGTDGDARVEARDGVGAAQAQVADSGGEQRRDEAFVLDEAFEGHGAHPARLGDAAVSVRVAQAFCQFTTREAGHHRVGVAEALAPRVCRSGDGRRAPARAQ